MQRKPHLWVPKLGVIMEGSCIAKSYSLSHNPSVSVYDCKISLWQFTQSFKTRLSLISRTYKGSSLMATLVTMATLNLQMEIKDSLHYWLVEGSSSQVLTRYSFGDWWQACWEGGPEPDGNKLPRYMLR